MSENSLNPIRNNRPTETGLPTRIPFTPAPAKLVHSVSPAPEKPIPPEADSFQKSKENAAVAVGTLVDLSIQFRVDDKTNDLTIFIVDRKSKRVLRSIPADELRKLQAGDLFKLTA